MSPSRTKVRQAHVHYKRYSLLKLRAPLLKFTPLCVEVSSGPLCVPLWELRLRKLVEMLIFWLLTLQ